MTQPIPSNGKKYVEFGSGISWTLSRALPLSILSLLLGAVVGWLRWGIDFFPGIQGLFWGGIIGAAAGFAGRHDHPELWRPGQRFWVLISVQACFYFGLLTTLSLMNRPVLAPPLTWLIEVLQGSHGERFFGASVFNPLTPVSGALSGGGWIAFNMLDFILFFFIGIITVGVVIQKWQPHDEEPSSPPRLHYKDNLARRFFLFQGALLLIAMVLLGSTQEGSHTRQTKFEALALMEELAGRYVFDDGAYLLGKPGEPGAFVLDVRGFYLMHGQSETDRNYTFSLDGQPPYFTGRLYSQNGRPTSVRARFSDDGTELTIAGRVTLRSGQRIETALTAKRE